jgi:hypothetical protein
MERKAIMGIAAVAGIGLLLYLRKSGDSSTLAGATSLLNSAGGATSWASQPIVITTNTKAPAVVDTNTKSPPVTTAPASSSSATPVFGGSGTGGSRPIDGLLMDGNGNWVPADKDKATPYAGYTFGSSPNTGQTDRQRTLSILGY